MFNGSIKRFLQRSMSLFRYLGETSVRRALMRTVEGMQKCIH